MSEILFSPNQRALNPNLFNVRVTTRSVHSLVPYCSEIQLLESGPPRLKKAESSLTRRERREIRDSYRESVAEGIDPSEFILKPGEEQSIAPVPSPAPDIIDLRQ